MTDETPLDAAHEAAAARPGDEAAQLRIYERLADGELFLLLEREATGAVLEPKIFALESGPVVLAFDREERLAAFAAGVVPYAALPGRVIAGMLKGQGIGLGVNLGVAPSQMLLPPEAMDWLALALEGEPELVEAAPERFLPPSLPAEVAAGLEAKLAAATGLATAALLCGVAWGDGRRGHLLAFLDAAPGAETALARAMREALVFSGEGAPALDVVFLDAAAPAAAAMARVGQRRDLALPERKAAPPTPPGMDPSRPPKLR